MCPKGIRRCSRWSVRDVREITSELIASGLSQAQTALLMELVLSMSTGKSGANPVESPEYRTLERRRAWDRDRKRRLRDAKNVSAISTGNPVESGGMSTGNADIPCLLEVKKEGLSVGKEVKKGSRLPRDARARDEDREFAITAGIPPDRVEPEWSEFVDYWIGVAGSRGVKLDWPATWRNRVRQVAPKYKGRNGHAVNGHRTDHSTGRATAREADLVAALGRGAAGRLAERVATGSTGQQPSNDAGTASIFDSVGGTKNAH